MAIGINELDVEDQDMQQTDPQIDYYGNIDEENYVKPLTNVQETVTPQNNIPEPGVQTQDDTLLTQLLHSKGISDPNKIKFEDENGQLQDRTWNSLSNEEKYNILATPNESPERDLDDSEIALINDIRSRNMSPDEYLNATVQYGAQQFSQQTPPELTYKVDEISDDELYMIDLKARTPDITDDELTSALEGAKQNEELYKKQIAGIRKEYQDLETQRNQENQAIAYQQQQDQFNAFASQIYNSIDGMDEIAGLDVELSDDDKEELADFILGQDGAGVSNLSRAINDPETLTKMCWFALKGVETIDGMVDYFKNEITKVRENSYRQGYEAAGGKQPPRVVVTPPKQTTASGFSQQPQKVTSIDDLD